MLRHSILLELRAHLKLYSTQSLGLLSQCTLMCALRLDVKAADHAMLLLVLLLLHNLVLAGVDSEDWRPLTRRSRRLQTAQDGTE
jgi:hypothetical protein